jgi:hypothetical protein
MAPSSTTTCTPEPATSAFLPSENGISGARCPHEVPDLSVQTLIGSSHPILYLPPRLSSLPDSISPDTPTNHHTTNRLPHIDPASLSLHKSLHKFGPLTLEYASTPYADAFNWAEMSLPEEEEREWYCVVFRSKRKAGGDETCKFLNTLNFITGYNDYT